MKLFSIASLSLLLFSFASHAKILNRTVVIVNNDVILESDIKLFQKKLRSKSFQELFGGVDPNIVKNRDAVVQLMIDEKIIDQQVKKLELSVTDQEIDGQIRAILTRNGITKKQLVARLKMLKTNFSDYRQGIKRQTERRNLIEREIKPSLEVSDEQLRHFYNQNAGAKGAEKQFTISHILISGNSKRSLTRANKIYKELDGKPERFAALAKDSSDDDSSSESGGDLGTFAASSLSKEFRKAIIDVAQGTITKPVKTSGGYHIIYVKNIGRGSFKTLSKPEKEALRNQMLAVEVERRMKIWLSRKRNDSYINFGKKRKK